MNTVGLVIGGWAAGWLLVARWLYGRWRGTGAGRRGCARHGTPKRRATSGHPECCMDAGSFGDGQAAAFASIAALGWPVVVLVALVRWRPPQTPLERSERQAELAAGRRKRADHIAELERTELGIGGDPR